MIFIWSVQHTGTWTTIDWLERRERLGPVCQDRIVKQALNDVGVTTSIGGRDLEQGISESCICHSHVAADSRSQAFQLQLVLAYAHPCVVPLREPLASLLTGHNRMAQAGSGISLAGHLAQWRAMVEGCGLLEKAGKPVLTMPWDQLGSNMPDERSLKNARLSFLWEASCVLNWRDVAVDMQFARDWPVSNSSGGYPEKVAYERGDAEWIRRRLPGMWTLLKEAEPELRPFLEQAGYRDLMWWG